MFASQMKSKRALAVTQHLAVHDCTAVLQEVYVAVRDHCQSRHHSGCVGRVVRHAADYSYGLISRLWPPSVTG